MTDRHEEYFNLPLEVDESAGQVRKSYVSIVYDISDNKRRARFAKLLSSFGYRVQESVFEAVLPRPHHTKLCSRIAEFAEEDDDIRIYALRGAADVVIYGGGRLPTFEDTEFV